MSARQLDASDRGRIGRKRERKWREGGERERERERKRRIVQYNRDILSIRLAQLEFETRPRRESQPNILYLG